MFAKMLRKSQEQERDGVTTSDERDNMRSKEKMEDRAQITN